MSDDGRKLRRRKSGSKLTGVGVVEPPRPPPVRTISCGKGEGKESIQAAIQQLPGDVTILVVEGLLSTKRKTSVSPLIDALIFANDRPWQQIRFRDSFELDHYGLWHGQKAPMIVGYQEKDVHEPQSPLYRVCAWNANIKIPIGTKAEVFMDLLRDIKDDPHVIDMRLNGGLPSPSGVVKKIDWSIDPVTKQPSNTLLRPMTIDLECGWVYEPENSTAFKMFINVCLCKFKDAQRQEKRKTLDRAQSMRIGKGRSRSPVRDRSRSPVRDSPHNRSEALLETDRSENSVQRTKSMGSMRKIMSGDVDGSSPRRSQRRLSPTRDNQKLKPSRVISLESSDKSASANRTPSPSEAGGRGRRREVERSPSTVVSEPKEKPQSDEAKCWKSAVDPTSGKTYYYHKKTKETRWDKPY